MKQTIKSFEMHGKIIPMEHYFVKYIFQNNIGRNFRRNYLKKTTNY